MFPFFFRDEVLHQYLPVLSGLLGQCRHLHWYFSVLRRKREKILPKSDKTLRGKKIRSHLLKCKTLQILSPVVYPMGMTAQTCSVYFTIFAGADCFVQVSQGERKKEERHLFEKATGASVSV